MSGTYRSRELCWASLTAAVVLGAAVSGCSGVSMGDTDGTQPAPPGNGMTSEGPVDKAMTEPSVPATYWPNGVDQGTAKPDDRFRALMILPMRNVDDLVQLVQTLYDPASPQFRKYLTPSDYLLRYAPLDADLAAVTAWLASKGMKVERVAQNRLMLEYSGTVSQFNLALGTELHVISRMVNSDRKPAFAPLTALDVPAPLLGKIRRMLMPDLAAVAGTLAPDSGTISKVPPIAPSTGLSPRQLAKAYGLTGLYAQGCTGAGTRIGVVGGSLFRDTDAQSMWQTFGIARKNAVVIQTMEPITVRDSEASLDVQLSGAIAPDAEVIYYGGPDNSDASLLYSFNEAIGAGQVDVITDSFAHAEATTSASVARSYDESALIAAALGITIAAAAGDSQQVDVPSDSPYVSAVGGTTLTLAADGSWQDEKGWGTWGNTGCGMSKVFAQPSWQAGSFSGAKGFRTVADVAMSVGPDFIKYLGDWWTIEGTSCASPLFAGVVAVVNSCRKQAGKPRLGYLNPLLYQNPAVRASFRDLVKASPGGCAAGKGYDLATGLGSPLPQKLVLSIP